MRIIIGLHSLPGGVNGLDIGEAFGHDVSSNAIDLVFKSEADVL